jgi:hypothetical protein
MQAKELQYHEAFSVAFLWLFTTVFVPLAGDDLLQSHACNITLIPILATLVCIMITA